MKTTSVKHSQNPLQGNALPGFVFILWIILFSFGGAPVFIDPDSGWHIAAGDLIRQLHHLPRQDPWSFTAGTQVWYNLSWLFDVAVSFVNMLGGTRALYGFTILSFAGLGAFMAHWSLRRGAWMTSVVFMCLLSGLAVYGGVLLRPNLVSAILTVVFYVVLSDESRREKRYPLFLLPALTVLWVNCHGGVLGGFILIALFFAAALLQDDKRAARRIALQGVLCLVATLANPYGYEAYVGMSKTLGSSFGKQYVTEWKSFSAGDKGHRMLFTFLLMSLWFTPFTRRALPIADRLVVLCWLMLSLLSVRHSIILGLLAIPLLSLAITQWLEESRFAVRLRRKEAEYRADFTQSSARKAVMAACGVWVVLLFSCYPLKWIVPHAGEFDAKQMPTAEVAYIQAHYPNRRFFNDYNLGGFLIYAGRGEPKLFVDGRADTAYPRDVLKDYLAVAKHAGLDEEGKKVLEKYRIEGLIFSNQTDILPLFVADPHWRVAFKGDAATVLVKR